MFKPGLYYIGDPFFVLPSKDLRMFFTDIMQKNTCTGVKELVSSIRFDSEMDKFLVDYYWMAKTPKGQGTLFDDKLNGWGVDWDCFAVIPWDWIEDPGSYLDHKFEFDKPFICSVDETSIKVDNLNFYFKKP